MKKKDTLLRIGMGILMVILTIGRLMLADELPIFGIVPAGHDDLMMVLQGNSLAHGNWLQGYHNLTLVKGISFPLVLSICSWTGLKLTTCFILFWAASCLLFLQAISPLLPKKAWLKPLLYAILLYHPVFANVWVGMRVYRNGIVVSQVLMIFGGMFGVLCRYRQGFWRMLPWAIYGSVSFVFFWYTREDSFWILPFMAVFVIVMAVLILRKKENWKLVLPQLLLLLLPFAVKEVVHTGISYQNNRAFGEPIVNELQEGSFPKAMRLMYAIKSDADLPWDVTVSREKLKLFYENSSSMETIEPYLEVLMDQWDVVDRTPGDHEVEDGWFFWVFREAAAQAGYHDTLSHAQQFYQSVYEELQEAVDSGRLQCGTQMPSALLVPVREEYLELLPERICTALYDMLTLYGANVYPEESMLGLAEQDELFQAITNNQLYTSELCSEEEMGYYAERFAVLDRIADGYHLFELPLLAAAVIGFLFFVLTVLLKKKLRTEENVTRLLILLAMLLSLLVFAGGIAYNDISSCQTIAISYICVGYGLAMAWELLSIVYAVQLVFGGKKEEENLQKIQ